MNEKLSFYILDESVGERVCAESLLQAAHYDLLADSTMGYPGAYSQRELDMIDNDIKVALSYLI